MVNVTEVVAVEVPDRPGGLAEVLEIDRATAQINIEYMYAFTFGRDDRAVLIFRFETPRRRRCVTSGTGINVVVEP